MNEAQTQVQRLLHWERARQVLDRLAVELPEERFLLLKGMAAIELGLVRAENRSMRDVDLLLENPNIQKARFERAGLLPLRPSSTIAQAYAFAGESYVELDLHHQAVPPGMCSLSRARLFEGATPSSRFAQNLRVPTIDGFLLHAISNVGKDLILWSNPCLLRDIGAAAAVSNAAFFARQAEDEGLLTVSWIIFECLDTQPSPAGTEVSREFARALGARLDDAAKCRALSIFDRLKLIKKRSSAAGERIPPLRASLLARALADSPQAAATWTAMSVFNLGTRRFKSPR